MKAAKFNDILRAVADHFDIEVSDLLTGSRVPPIPTARAMLRLICREQTWMSGAGISRLMGVDHSTGVNLQRRAHRLLEESEDFQTSYKQLTEELEGTRV